MRPDRILFPLLPLRIFGNTSADPSRCLADPLVAHEALLDLDMVAADGCRSLDVARKRGQHLGSRRYVVSAAASWLAVALVQKVLIQTGTIHSDHASSCCSHGLQRIAKPFNIPEKSSA